MSNVLINGMSAVHADSGGVLTTTDICKTPVGNSTPPLPYVNIATSADADGTASSVLINGKPVCTKNSIFSKSAGDEAGRNGGLQSGTTQGAAEFLSASPNVLIEGVEAARAFDLMVSNDQNTPPAPLMQPAGMPPLALSAGDPGEKEVEEGPCALGVGIADLGPSILSARIGIEEESE